MTKLDAVNEILAATGRPPITVLDTNGQSHAAHAERELDRAELEIQSRGWTYNTRKEVELSPDGTSRIAVPESAITIDADGDDAHRGITQIGAYLYSLDENSDEFDSDLTVTYILRYEFTCIPYPVQHWIVRYAAAEFNLQHGVPEKHHLIEQRRIDAEHKAKKFENDMADANILTTREAQELKGVRKQSAVRID